MTGIAPAGPSVADLASLIRIDADAGTIDYDGSTFTLDALDPRRGLATWLYANIHAGNPDVFATTSLLPDQGFETSIRDALPDPGVEVAAEAPLGVAADDGPGRVVEIHRVRVRFGDSQLTGEAAGLRARISCLRPNLTPGFFMFVHDQIDKAAAPDTVRRHYVRFEDPDDALAFWSATVHELVARGLSFRTKILSRPDAFPRNDSLVYYSSVDTAEVEEVLVAAIAAADADGAGVVGDGSPLAAEVVPGLRLAANPRPQAGSGREQSFGESRCAALAVGIANAVITGDEPVDALRVALVEAGIDPDDVSRNAAPESAASAAPSASALSAVSAASDGRAA